MLTKDYILGLTDGEGSFTVYVRPPDKKHQAKSWRIEFHYYLKMREDELPLLKEIKKFFGCGSISFQKDKRQNHRNCYRFEINDRVNLKNKIIPLFKKNSPRSSNRKKDFQLFCRIFELVEKKAQRTSAGLKKIKEIKSRMHC
ncbi:MAG: LAGLIDADG family homing endonuclease [Nanoarchaeota archaeon]|nr:LAGLIDADG family homing endonuclease [Nanoarchaeota archaeon]